MCAYSSVSECKSTTRSHSRAKRTCPILKLQKPDYQHPLTFNVSFRPFLLPFFMIFNTNGLHQCAHLELSQYQNTAFA